MSSKDDFKATDQFFSESDTSIEKVEPNSGLVPAGNGAVKNMLEHRKSLLKGYHKGHNTLADKLKKENRSDIESLIVALITEMISETDNLKGNELIAMEEGNLRDATIISDKRASVIAQIIKAAQNKHEFDKERGGFDIDSPALRVVFAFFMEKVRDSFTSLNYNDEQSDIFFRTLGTNLNDWKKDLKNRLAEKNSIGDVKDGEEDG